MTLNEIRKITSNPYDVGMEWLITRFISFANKPNDILTLSGGDAWNNTTGAYNRQGEPLTIKDDESDLCVTFYGAIRIYDAKELQVYWTNRIQIAEQLRIENKALKTKPLCTMIYV